MTDRDERYYFNKYLGFFEHIGYKLEMKYLNFELGWNFMKKSYFRRGSGSHQEFKMVKRTITSREMEKMRQYGLISIDRVEDNIIIRPISVEGLRSFIHDKAIIGQY